MGFLMKTRILKNSGIAWIGEIPKHWEVKKAKYLFKNKKEIVGTRAEFTDRLALTLNGVVKRSKDDNEGLQPKKFESYQTLRKNNLVFKLIDLENISTSRVGISNFDLGIVSPAYIVLQRKENNKFFYYFFMSMYYGCVFNFLGGQGVRSSLNVSDLLNLYLPVPPLNEQERIAEFLDKKCASIDSSIENLEQKIKSLAEYKKALITQCVTKGLNPKNMEFKDSQIPWIGQIPKHWEISKIKYYFNFSSGLNITKENLIESGIPVISYGQIHSKENTGTFIKDSFFRFISQDYLKNKKSLVNKGNFIFADTSEDLDGAGNSVFVDLDLTMFAGYHTIILKNKCNFEFSKFLSYLFQTDLWRSQIRLAVSGVKVFSITKKILANCEILVPPLTEQEKIAGFLDKKCEKIDNLSANYKEQIKTLKEYKKALIYECVTGKKQI